MKQLYLSVLIFYTLFTFNLSAQEDTTVRDRPFGKNWYLQAGAGTQILFAADAGKLSFRERLSPDFTLITGKWISPSFGMRLRFNGYKLNGMSTTEGLYIADPQEGNLVFGNNDPVRSYAVINPDGSYRHDVFFFNTSLDFQFSILNLLNRFDENSKWDIIPGVGLGYMHVFNHEGTPAANLMTTSFSVMGTYRLNSRFDVNAELYTSVFPDQFDGRIMGRTEESKLGLNIGITFHPGRHGFKKPGVAMLVPSEENEPAVMVQTDTVYVEKIVTVKEKSDSLQPFALCSVLFDINSIIPKPGQDVLFINIADFLKKNPGRKIRLDAYTDDETGSEIYNSSLAKGRAAYIKGMLVNGLGVSGIQVEENPVGPVNQPYDRSDFNRVVVVTVLEP